VSFELKVQVFWDVSHEDWLVVTDVSKRHILPSSLGSNIQRRFHFRVLEEWTMNNMASCFFGTSGKLTKQGSVTWQETGLVDYIPMKL
jgi:hypothetical protein